VRKGRLVVPRRGFYVIVPMEYSLVGAPPASWFVADLMAYLQRPYYVGLLSAAALYGAAHQQPMVFQVVTDAPLRCVEVGRAHIRFVQKSGLERTPTMERKTSTGFMKVSTPEATALDIVRYYRGAGHLDHVATVLAELGEELDAERLVAAAQDSAVEVSVVQRLGYLLELVDHQTLVQPLAAWLAARNPAHVMLLPGAKSAGFTRNGRWRVIANADVEPDV
jgi:predicted transcriptional regulator of viral defense system